MFPVCHNCTQSTDDVQHEIDRNANGLPTVVFWFDFMAPDKNKDVQNISDIIRTEQKVRNVLTPE